MKDWSFKNSSHHLHAVYNPIPISNDKTPKLAHVSHANFGATGFRLKQLDHRVIAGTAFPFAGRQIG